VKAGMTRKKRWKTATSQAAELLGKANELGAVAPGYFADLVAVEGDLRRILEWCWTGEVGDEGGLVAVDRMKDGR